MASSEKKAQKERRDERKMKEHLSEDVLKFQEIFDNHWAEAHDALESDLPEMKIANVLLEIVQRAFTFNRDDALAQLRKAKICAEQIVTDNKIMDEAQGRVGNDIAEELREYRYLQASRALPRARNNFLGNDFKQVMKKYDIAFGGTRKELEAYASKCVEVTWYLCAEDPPVHMILNDAQLFDENLFKTLKMKDAKIDYILWPALKQSENGHVLLKGMAVRKT